MPQKFASEVPGGNSVPLAPNKKFREWCFTINNPTDADWEQVRKADCRYACYAPETGESGTRHIQGYIVFSYQKRLREVSKLLPRAHLVPARGTGLENKTYIQGPYTKEEKHKPVNNEFEERGDIPEQGKRNDLVLTGQLAVATKRERALLDAEECWLPLAKYPKFFHKLLSRQWEKEAIELYESGFTPEVYVLWSRTSGTGKSRFVYSEHGADNICRGNIASKSGKLWWDSYDGQTVLLIEEFEGQLEYTQWKQLTDRYPIQLEVKGSYSWCVRKRIFFTSNKHPDEWWKLDAIEKTQLDRRITKVIEVVDGVTPVLG